MRNTHMKLRKTLKSAEAPRPPWLPGNRAGGVWGDKASVTERQPYRWRTH